jgi:N-carbamoylputrescine amidase
MAETCIAATQMECGWDIAANHETAERLVRTAAAQGAGLVLLQELFETPYFCPEQKAKYFALARPADGNPLLARMAAVAKELGVVLPISFFEAANNAYYNSIAIIDADGRSRGLYRKSHIPQGPGYEEKFYFAPGDTGFRAWDTAVGRIGVGICWDQWFPEAARAMALMGAEILLYPTAIGSEPQDASLNSFPHWQRVMQGHAGANMCPLVASNRIGAESWDNAEMRFYGGSFVAGPTGEVVAQASHDFEEVIAARFDLAAIRAQRASWGLFRDRRPDLYGPLLTRDGGQA